MIRSQVAFWSQVVALLALGVVPPLSRADTLDEIARMIEACRKKAEKALKTDSRDRRCLSVEEGLGPELLKVQRAFCRSGAEYCAEFRNCPPEKRYEWFVSSGCRPATSMSGFKNMDGVNVRYDREYARMVQTSWGCNPEPKQSVIPSGERFKVRVEYRCDPKKLPFACTMAGRSKDEIIEEQKVEKRNPDIALFLSIKTLGGKVRMDGKECVLSWESKESYPTQKHAESMASESLRLFTKVPAEEEATEVFKRKAKAIFSPEKVAMLEQTLARSKEGLIQYLKSRGAPDSVIRAIQGVRLLGMRFGRLMENDEEAMEELAQMCEGGNPSPNAPFFGRIRARSGSLSDRDPFERKLLICPATLLAADYGNPRTLYTMFLHELGHQLDPCHVAQLQAGTLDNAKVERFAESRCTSGTADRSTAGDSPEAQLWKFGDEVRRMGHCLHQNSAMGPDPANNRAAGPLVRESGINPKYLAFLKACSRQERTDKKYKGCGSYGRGSPELEACKLDLLYAAPQGLWSQCELGLTREAFSDAGEEPQDLRAARAELLAALSSDPPLEDQSSEAFADHLAAQVLPLALDPTQSGEESRVGPDPEYAKVKDRPADLAAEVLTQLTVYCEFREDAEHPHSDLRISLFAGAEGIRKMVGCVPARPIPASAEPAKENPFPAVGCELQKSRR